MEGDMVSVLETQEKLRMSVVDRDFIISPVILSSQEIRYYDGPIVYEEFSPVEGFILDDVNKGVLDEDLLYDTVFVLGSSVAGVLGQTAMGTSAAFNLSKITNPGDIFNFFGSTEEQAYFVASATATLSPSARTITFTGSQNIVLKAYLDEYTIQSATPLIDSGSLDDESNYTFAVSADGGSTWTNIGNGSTYNFPAIEQGTDLRLRITSAASGIICLTDRYGAFLPIRLRYGKI